MKDDQLGTEATEQQDEPFPQDAAAGGSENRVEKPAVAEAARQERGPEVPLQARLADYFGAGPQSNEAPAQPSVSGAGRKLLLPLAAVTVVLLLLCLIFTVAGALAVPSDQAATDPDGSGGEAVNPLAATAVLTGNLPALVATVTLPPIPAGNNSLVLFYNERGFYAWNPGQKDIEVNGLAFEALAEDEQPAGFRFDAQRWAGFYPLIEEGKCDLLEIVDVTHPPRPKECRSINAMMTPEGDDRMVFWLPREGVTTFRILWNNQEIGRCPVIAGQCEAQLP